MNTQILEILEKKKSMISELERLQNEKISSQKSIKVISIVFGVIVSICFIAGQLMIVVIAAVIAVALALFANKGAGNCAVAQQRIYKELSELYIKYQELCNPYLGRDQSMEDENNQYAIYWNNIPIPRFASRSSSSSHRTGDYDPAFGGYYGGGDDGDCGGGGDCGGDCGGGDCGGDGD